MPKTKSGIDPEVMTTWERKKHYSKENEERSAMVIVILLKGYSADTEGWSTALTDLLADIRHFCDAKNLNLGDIDRIAHGHYLAELGQAMTGEPPRLRAIKERSETGRER